MTVHTQFNELLTVRIIANIQYINPTAIMRYRQKSLTLFLQRLDGDSPQNEAVRHEDDEEGNDEDAEHIEYVIGLLMKRCGKKVEGHAVLLTFNVRIFLRMKYDTLLQSQ